MSNASMNDAEELDAFIIKMKCPSGENHMADMIVFRTAHEGVFDHTDIHCEHCFAIWNTEMMFMPSVQDFSE